MGHARQEDALEVGEDPLQGLARGRRRRRQLSGDRAGLDLGADRVALHARQIVRHPVDQPMPVPAKLIQVHGVVPPREVAARSTLVAL